MIMVQSVHHRSFETFYGRRQEVPAFIWKFSVLICLCTSHTGHYVTYCIAWLECTIASLFGMTFCHTWFLLKKKKEIYNYINIIIDCRGTGSKARYKKRNYNRGVQTEGGGAGGRQS